MTLGDVLYADSTIPQESEKSWEAMLQSIAARDVTALHALWERTHRLVYTLNLRLTANPQTAEELTLQVFYDVWTGAQPHDPAKGTVLAWIMNKSRARAIERLCAENGALPRPQDSAFAEQGRLLSEALQGLTPQEREAIESAYFSDVAQAYVASRLKYRPETFRTWVRSGLDKLRQALERKP